MRTDGGMKNSHYSIWHTSDKTSLASTKAALCEVEGYGTEVSYSRAACSRAAPAPRKSRGFVGSIASMFTRRSSRSELRCSRSSLGLICEAAETYGG